MTRKLSRRHVWRCFLDHRLVVTNSKRDLSPESDRSIFSDTGASNMETTENSFSARGRDRGRRRSGRSLGGRAGRTSGPVGHRPGTSRPTWAAVPPRMFVTIFTGTSARMHSIATAMRSGCSRTSASPFTGRFPTRDAACCCTASDRIGFPRARFVHRFAASDRRREMAVGPFPDDAPEARHPAIRRRLAA